MEPPLQWLLEVALAPDPISVSQLVWDVGAQVEADEAISAWFKEKAKSSEPIGLEWPKAEALQSYRMWVKTAQVRGAGEFTGAEVFWNSVKRLLNPTIFPRRTLFRSSSGKRFVCLPPRRELLEGFKRFLGAEVINPNDDDQD